MTDLTTTRTPEVIAAEVRALTATVLTNVIEIGRRFAEAKAMLPHGEFGAWLEESTGYSQRTANNFMRLFEAYGDQQASLFGTSSNSQTFANLPYSKALALLSVPEAEREAFAQEVDAEGISLKELQAKIKEREREAEELRGALASAKTYGQTVETALQEARDDLETARDRIQELQSRPTEVAVREPTPEELDAAVADRLRESEALRLQAMSEASTARIKAETDLASKQQEIKDLKTKLKAAKDQQDKAVEAAKTEAAKEAAAQVEELKKDLEASQHDAQELINQMVDLKRQVEMADEATISFKAAFGQWQRARSDMMRALERAAPETAKKLRAAMAAQLENWSKEV